MLGSRWIRPASPVVRKGSAIAQRPHTRPIRHFQVLICHDAAAVQFAWQRGDQRIRGRSGGPNHRLRRNTRTVAQFHPILEYTDHPSADSNLHSLYCMGNHLPPAINSLGLKRISAARFANSSFSFAVSLGGMTILIFTYSSPRPLPRLLSP